MAKLFKVLIELYELLITGRKNDRMGRVLSTGSITIYDLIKIAHERRSDISPMTMLAVYNILREIALEEVHNSKHVEFGLTHNRLGVAGTFIGDHAQWDSEKNHLYLISIPSADVRETLKDAEVQVLGMAQSGLFVNTLTDVVSGEVNSRITPAGGVNLTGVKIKIAGNAEGVGIHLTEINSGTVTEIPKTAILVNGPSKISFVVPASLPAGDYRLSITTQFANNATLLKEPRTYVLDCVLMCNV